jgi:nickel/cobalt transporter (NicO) family protein
MADFAALLQQGSAHAWLFIPSAILLGALHGLEPGHSKTMMAAFIVAIRGTIGQAVLLGVAATVSHTMIVWVIALGGMYLWSGMTAESAEPYLQMASGVIIIALALWMFRSSRPGRDASLHDAHGHHHDHQHDHGHPHDHDHPHPHDQETVWTDGVQANSLDAQDAHTRAHAEDVERRFANGPVTTWQIAAFGLTGGLIPCPAAVTVLILCLQLKEIALGATLVLSFSVGLALTLVSVGVLAAIGSREASKRIPGLAAIAQIAPYLSVALMILVGVYMLLHGWSGLGMGNPLHWIFGMQGWIHGEVRTFLKGYAETRDWTALAAILPFGVVFGAIHALTPGHGKSILASYLAGSRLNVLRGVGVSSILAGTHVGMSVLLAATAAPLIEKTLTGAGRAPALELVSYSVLGAIGVWFLVRAALDRPHTHTHHEGYSVGAFAGLVPCPLTLFAMIAAIGFGVVEAGLAFALAMVIGVALTLGGLATAVVAARERVADLAARYGASIQVISRVLDGVSGAGLLLIALLFLMRA